MAWLLAYLLVGFVLHFIGGAIYRAPHNNDWRWELATIFFWPAVALIAAYNIVRTKMKRQ